MNCIGEKMNWRQDTESQENETGTEGLLAGIQCMGGKIGANQRKGETGKKLLRMRETKR